MPAERKSRKDPAAQDGRRDAVPGVAEPEVDPTARQRPEPRPVVVGDVDRAAPCVSDPTAEAGSAASSAKRDSTIGRRSGVVERESRVGDPLAAGPADVREKVGN